MNVSDFDFDLPEELIALRPARPRDSARLLVVRGPGGVLEDRSIADLPQLLRAGDVLVANDTRVIRAALTGHRASREDGGPPISIDVNLNRRLAPHIWSAFARPGKRLKPGDTIVFAAGLAAAVLSKGDAGDVELGFNKQGEALDDAIESAGEIPLPPYIALKRPPDALDAADYQTTFARDAGSVAAPTAGLHFTPALLDAIAAAGIAARPSRCT